MKRFVTAVAAVFVLSWAGAAHAQTAPAIVTTSFVAIDALTVDHHRLIVTGVVEGEAAAVTREFHFTIDASTPYEQRQSCERLALLAMSKPGMYAFVVQVGWNYGYPSCSLRRVTP